MSVKYDDKTKTWTAIVYFEGKHYWRRGFPTKKAAQKAELELKVGFSNLTERLKFNELAVMFLSHQKKVYRMTTVKTNESRYDVHIKPYLGNKYIDKITTKDIQTVVHKLSTHVNGYSNSYINHIVSTIGAILNYAVDMGYISKNPAKKIKKLKENREELQYMKKDEFDALYDVICEDIYYSTFLLILFYMGFRVGECRALLWSQINFETNTISNDAHVVDKGGTRREPGRKNNVNYTAYMPQNVRNALLEIYKLECKKDGFDSTKYVFGFYEPWSYNKIRTRFKNGLKKAGLRDMKIHSLRHGYASLLVNNGATIQELSSALGDTLEVTINTYSHMYDDTNKQICRRIDMILEGEKDSKK